MSVWHVFAAYPHEGLLPGTEVLYDMVSPGVLSSPEGGHSCSGTEPTSVRSGSSQYRKDRAPAFSDRREPVLLQGGFFKVQTIPVKRLADMEFSDLGSYYNFADPTGFHAGGEYFDKLLFPVSGQMPLAFSCHIAERPHDMTVSSAEQNIWSPKAIMPIDGDIICCGAPPSKVVYPSMMQAFLVEKGTMVVLNAGVWHRMSFAAKPGQVHVLVLLPQLSFMHESKIVEFPVKDWTVITDEYSPKRDEDDADALKL